MEIWIGAEFEGDIDDQLMDAQNFVEDEINLCINGKSYDIELDGWDCIAIVMGDDPFHDEVVKYSKKKRDMDFRLKINFDAFVKSDALGQQKLFFQMLQRSLDLLIEKGANESGVKALRADVETKNRTGTQ